MLTDLQLLSADLRSLERHRRTLETLRDELTSPLIVMGPGSAGRDALRDRGAIGTLETLLGAYDQATRHLATRYHELEAIEARQPKEPT